MAYWENHTPPFFKPLPSRAGEAYLSPQKESPCIRLAARLLQARSSESRQTDVSCNYILIPPVYFSSQLQDQQLETSTLNSYGKRYREDSWAPGTSPQVFNDSAQQGPRFKRRRVLVDDATAPKQRFAKAPNLITKIRSMQAELEQLIGGLDPVARQLSETMDEVIEVIDGALLEVA